MICRKFPYTAAVQQSIRSRDGFSGIFRGASRTLSVQSAMTAVMTFSTTRARPHSSVLHAGPGNVELTTEEREHFPELRFIRFSELGFALFSCLLKADYLNFLPITGDKLRKALRNCANHRSAFRSRASGISLLLWHKL